MNLQWKYDDQSVDWKMLSELYRIAPLGEKNPNDLKVTFGNSMFKCFVLHEGMLVGAGRALADGVDCSYLCDVAIHPEFQGLGLGKAIVQTLLDFSKEHKKIILYANPGKEPFYRKLGFSPMNTAMAIFKNHEYAVGAGFISRS